MSNEHLIAYRSAVIDATAKAVLMAMADIADASGALYPSIDYLSSYTCLNRVSVIRAISRLEEAGFITANRDNGRKTTYEMHLKPVAQSDRLQKVTGIPKQHNRLNKVTKPVEQSNTNHHESSININTRAKDSADLFERFYESYPRHTAKQKARAAWDKLKLTPNDPRIAQMRRGLAAAKQSRQWLEEKGRYIPHAATWLNGERWNDELPAANVIPIGGMEAPQISSKVAV